MKSTSSQTTNQLEKGKAFDGYIWAIATKPSDWPVNSITFSKDWKYLDLRNIMQEL